MESQTEVYFKTDPDPFDDRHPGRADPDCTLGHVLKVILKSDDFIQSVRFLFQNEVIELQLQLHNIDHEFDISYSWLEHTYRGISLI